MNRVVDVLAIEQLKKNWLLYLFFGINWVLLGTLALIFSTVSTLVSVVLLGIFMLYMGSFEIVSSFKITKLSSFLLHIFVGVLYYFSGFYLIIHPSISAINLTLMFAILFVVAGLLRIIFSFTKNIPHKGWLLFNGILTTILGILIWQQWPYSGLWVIGTFVGIEAIFTGWTWIMFSLAAKSYKSDGIKQ
jgi:uncharacterized membrane protein HdeD (DUF308 family)